MRTDQGIGGILDSPDDGRGFIDRFPGRSPCRAGSNRPSQHYVQEFRRTGFTGGLNWYRNLDRNSELTPQLAGARVEVPSFFVSGALDPVLAMRLPTGQDEWLADHRGTVIIEHLVQQEEPEPVNAALIGFLDSIGRRGSS